MSDISVAILKPGQDPVHATGRLVFVSTFDFGDKVKIDGGEVTAIVIGLCVYPHGNQVQVSWWNNGAIVEQWLASWRVTKVD